MRLQLADAPSAAQYQHLAQDAFESQEDNPYIEIPASVSPSGQVLWIREDYFDYMGSAEWAKYMMYLDAVAESEEIGYDNSTPGMSGIFSNLFDDRRERRLAKRNAKQARKDARLAAKIRKQDAKTRKKSAKAYTIEQKAYYGGQTGEFDNPFNTAVGAWENVITTGITELAPYAPAMISAATGGIGGIGGMFGGGGGAGAMQPRRGLPPWVLPVAGVAVLGGILYFATRK